MKNIEQRFEQLLIAIEKLGAPIPAIPAVPALLGTLDHDLIIRLGEKIDGLKEDIKELKDGMTTKTEDHEKRIKSLEISVTKLFSYGTALIFVVGVVQFLITKFWK